MSYSQNNEEQIIVSFFSGRTGKFLDIGAFDGLNLSNTRKLLELGWTGVLFEPDPRNFIKLVENMRPFQSLVYLVMAACTAAGGLGRFWMERSAGREWSSTSCVQMVNAGNILSPDEMTIFVPQVTVAQIANWGPFNFISIDAEWEDFAILKSIPQTALERTDCICLECRSTEERQEMKRFVPSIGFEVLAETPENLLLKKAYGIRSPES